MSGPESAAHLASLQGWLASDDALRGRVHQRRPPPAPGHMGSLVEVLTVVVGTGGIAGLITPLCTWLAGRRSDVTVTVELPDGRKVGVDVKRAGDPAAVIREANGLLNSPDGQDG
ncbi:hypothetical protein ACH4SK_05865 [Streptomyces inhibens]|uniref:effector-associated constant component EACC1 n=1 Tax=Streptomyces inhibens TaxID=2293571 RepID=UPI0037A1D315